MSSIDTRQYNLSTLHYRIVSLLVTVTGWLKNQLWQLHQVYHTSYFCLNVRSVHVTDINAGQQTSHMQAVTFIYTHESRATA